jgi:hypothetical protein
MLFYFLQLLHILDHTGLIISNILCVWGGASTIVIAKYMPLNTGEL